MGRHRLFTAKSAHEQQFSNTLGARIATPFLGCFANSESPSYSQLNAQTRPGRSSNLGPTTNDVDGTGISQGKMIVSLVPMYSPVIIVPTVSCLHLSPSQ